jgi:hypothetical protein
MANENAPRRDEVAVHLNDELVEGVEADDSIYDNLEEVGKRPGDSASKAAWVDYCVSLGADRDYLEGDTDHNRLELDENFQPVVTKETHPGLTRDQLIELADSMGG